MEQSFVHTRYSTVSLTSFRTGAVPDRQSPGEVSHQSGDYRTTNIPPCWPVCSYWALLECRYCPNWATTDTPESPDYLRHLAAGYSRTALSLSLSLCTFTHNHVFTNMSGLSPYSCSTCPGFHHVHCTAVLYVRAFIVLLFYSYLNNTQTGIPIDLPNYPLNTITKHFYLELNNTLYLLTKTCISLSQDRRNN